MIGLLVIGLAIATALLAAASTRLPSLVSSLLVAYLALSGEGDTIVDSLAGQPQGDEPAGRWIIQFPNPYSHLVATGAALRSTPKPAMVSCNPM